MPIDPNDSACSDGRPRARPQRQPPDAECSEHLEHSQASLTGTNCTRSLRFATKMRIIRYVSCRDTRPKTYISIYKAGREMHTLAINTLSFNRL